MIDLQSIALSDWMTDTFIYTGLLIAFVLLVRRPVTRYFGPTIAYALWALPLLRLAMPPIVLPAWMAPAKPAAPEAAAGVTEPMMLIISNAPAAMTGAAGTASPVDAGLTVTELLIPLWLAGAAVFLGWRIREYVQIRRDLLADARPMGESGKVRLVETSAVSAPVAFGVIDKVVALPVNFMALLDVRARDMAIAHELEHHRGHDLLANIAAQPLLALHWFNPLAWWGWRAMRRDQEAACDARVVAGRARSERAVYAEVIAGFAAGEHLALAAPVTRGLATAMACPVLGEKSIIHRLRSLTLTDISTRRRRIGIAAITTTALALPLTASISYAQPPIESAAQQQQEQAEAAEAEAIEIVDPDTEVRVVRVERFAEGDAEEDLDIDIEQVEDGQRITIRTFEGEDGERRTVRRIIRRTRGDAEDTVMRAEEIRAVMTQVERELEGLDEEIEGHVARAIALRADSSRMRNNLFVIDEGQRGGRSINARCDGEEAVRNVEMSDGRQAMIICHTAIRAHAALGMREAIAAITANDQLSAELREEITRELEEAMAELEQLRSELGHNSSRFTVPAPPAPPKPPRLIERTGNVTFGYVTNGGGAQTVRVVPMVHPLTGVSAAAALRNQNDCDEAETATNA